MHFLSVDPARPDISSLLLELGHNLSSWVPSEDSSSQDLEVFDALICNSSPQRWAEFGRPLIVLSDDCLATEQIPGPWTRGLTSRRIFLATSRISEWSQAQSHCRLPWYYFPFLGDSLADTYSQPTSDIFFCPTDLELPADLKARTSASGAAPDFQGTVYIPESPEDRSLHWFYQSGIPLFCPSLDFLSKLRPQIPHWMRLDPYFTPACMEGIAYFSSFEELRRLLNQVDVQKMHGTIANGACRRREQALLTWSELCDRVSNSAGRDVRTDFLVRSLSHVESPQASQKLAQLLDHEKNHLAWNYWRKAPLEERLAPLLKQAYSLLDSKRPCCAFSPLRELTDLFPDCWEPHYLLAGAQMEMGLSQAAQATIERSIQLAVSPDECRLSQERQVDIYEKFDQWSEIENLYPGAPPESADGWTRERYLICLLRQCRFDEIVELTGSESPPSPLLFYRATALLARGEYLEGWSLYEHRDHSHSPLIDLWKGQDLSGKALLIQGEQGLGDLFMMCRFFRQLAQKGARVIVNCSCRQVDLIRTVEGVFSAVGEILGPLDCDYRVPLLSIPHRLGLTLDQLPGSVPYIAACPARLAEWEGRLDSSRFKIGLVWAGNPAHRNDSRRSLRLEQLRPLWTLPGVNFYSLQVGAACAQLASASGHIHDLSGWICDFSDTAAALSQLDLLISVDTSVAHLAGAMGKPCWVLLGAGSDWRWRTQGETTAWYPSVRLIRCGDDWKGGIERLAGDLSRSFAVGPS